METMWEPGNIHTGNNIHDIYMKINKSNTRI